MGLQRQNEDIRPTPKSTQQTFETIRRLCYITLQRQSGGVKNAKYKRFKASIF